MSNPFKNNLKANLRTLLTALGAVAMSFSLGSDQLWALIIAVLFPFISLVWSWAEGNFSNIGSWAKKLIQAVPPLLVYLNVLEEAQAMSISGVLLLVLTSLIAPSEADRPKV